MKFPEQRTAIRYAILDKGVLVSLQLICAPIGEKTLYTIAARMRILDCYICDRTFFHNFIANHQGVPAVGNVDVQGFVVILKLSFLAYQAVAHDRALFGARLDEVACVLRLRPATLQNKFFAKLADIKVVAKPLIAADGVERSQMREQRVVEGNPRPCMSSEPAIGGVMQMAATRSELVCPARRPEA